MKVDTVHHFLSRCLFWLEYRVDYSVEIRRLAGLNSSYLPVGNLEGWTGSKKEMEYLKKMEIKHNREDQCRNN